VDTTPDTTPDTALPAAGRPSATAARVAVFVGALALTATVGWQAGRMLAADPAEPAAVTTSAPSRS
jgi:hypothetical protein